MVSLNHLGMFLHYLPIASTVLAILLIPIGCFFGDEEGKGEYKCAIAEFLFMLFFFVAMLAWLFSGLTFTGIAADLGYDWRVHAEGADAPETLVRWLEEYGRPNGKTEWQQELIAELEELGNSNLKELALSRLSEEDQELISGADIKIDETVEVDEVYVRALERLSDMYDTVTNERIDEIFSVERPIITIKTT